MRNHKLGIITLLVAMGVGICAGNAASPRPPVKVFILAGQSNMLGPASVATFDYIGDDPATAPLLKQMRNPDGTPKVCDHVWISSATNEQPGNGECFGKLTAGYGMRKNPTVSGGKIGPEFTFGLRMEEKLTQPVLLIKTAWGGKSLAMDFRPPSAGPIGDPEKSGKYYRLMIEHVRLVLKDIKHVMPEYDPQQGYELGGFVWLQGWNDMIDKYTYKDTEKGNPYTKYSEWLADFIRDVRKDLNAPDLPFVIGVAGFGGTKTASPRYLAFREAMAAPAALPEFKGRVIAVPTAPFWDDRLSEIVDKSWRGPIKKKEIEKQLKEGKLTQEEAEKQIKETEVTPEERALLARGSSNKGFHYLGCAKTFALMGRAFADALLPLQKP